MDEIISADVVPTVSCERKPPSSESYAQLEALSYSDRLLLAESVLKRLSEDPLSARRFGQTLAAQPFLARFDARNLQDVSDSAVFTSEQRFNVTVAGVVFYILTKGKYPQDFWRDSVNEYAATAAGELWNRGKELCAFARKTADERQAADLLNDVKRLRRELEKRDVSAAIGDCDGVGAVKIFEMLWEVFVAKYGNYSAALWIKKISEFRQKQYRSRCEMIRTNIEAQLYAISDEGMLDKPSHDGCEDCSFADFLDGSAWLAAVADGVGSCVHSAVGSQTAVDVLADTLRVHLQRKMRGKNKRKKSLDWAGLMYYFKFRFAEELYSGWESAIKLTKEYAEGGADVSDFATTLQFVFGCDGFVACGRLGDGGFFLRKKITVGKETLYGGVQLNDGFSGVTRQEVFTLLNLKTDPSALSVDFFRSEEVSDVLIVSDGALGVFGDTIRQTEATVAELSALPFDSRCLRLRRLANLCSDCNETHHGSGDDSSLAYVRVKAEV